MKKSEDKAKKTPEIEVKQQYVYYLCAYQLTIQVEDNIGFAPIEIVTRLDDFKFTQDRLIRLRDSAMKKYLNELDKEDLDKTKILHCQLINIITLGIMTEEEFNAKIDV